jgi:uncharacterized membrane protein
MIKGELLMLNIIKKFQVKEWFIITILMLLITDLVILLNLPVLRDIIPFLFFTIIPGFLIVTILRLNKIEFLTKFLLSVGLSISILLAVGLFLNILYPILLKPLSLTPLLLSLNILMVILTVFVYQRNRELNTSNIFNFNFKLGDKLLAPLIFPILFPLMAVLGTYLMNTTLNNILILAMLFLIPFYIIVVAYLRDRIHPYSYPVALFMIGMGLVLMHALTSAHIVGRDVHQEFYCFQLTLANFHWNIYDYYNPYNACLSITILPTIYQVLTNMNPEYVFKLLFGLLGSVLPLMVYTVAKKYLNNKFAFFASLLFVFQVFFIDIVGAVRQEVAVIFFFLAIIVIFDCFGETKFEKSWVKKLLFLIFVSSMIVTHYTTSYVGFVLLIPIILLPFLKNLYKEHRITFVNFEVLIIYFLIVIIWFLLYAKVQFLAGSDVIQSTVAATAAATGAGGNYAFETSREGTVLSILGIGIKNLPNFIAVIANDLIFVTIGIGLLTILAKFRKLVMNKTVFVYNEIKILDSKLVLGGILSFILLAMFIILPSVSFFYGSDRLFFQLLIFTVPIFIIGTFKITEILNKVIKKPDLKVILILVLLISLFICNTHLQYEFTGIPFSPEYDKTGITRGELYIYDGELTTAKWIGTYRADDINVYSDAVGFTRLFISGVRTNVVGINFNNKTINGYIYMGNANVNEGKFYDTINSQQKVQRFNYFFNNKSRIFDDGYGQIWA